jgi:ADP-ribose pyrophosphatase
MSWPKILNVKREAASPWMETITRDVQFVPSGPVESYVAIGQPDYVVALAVTRDGRVPLVRQFRPAIERFSLEFPAGMVDPGEAPKDAISRELEEETGYVAEAVEAIGASATCASRISNSTISFFIRADLRKDSFAEELGVAVRLVTLPELRMLVLSGEFSEQTHLGVLALAIARGLVSF